MGLITKLKTKLFHYKLKKVGNSSDREVQARNINHTKKVGVIFFAENELAFETALRLYRFLRSEKVPQIEVAGFVPFNVMPEYVKVQTNFDYFNKKELNFYYQPTSESIQKFTEHKFDILIDLSLRDVKPLLYIVAESKATFKVGVNSPLKATFLDFIIDIEKDKSYAYLYQQFEKYLKYINSN